MKFKRTCAVLTGMEPRTDATGNIIDPAKTVDLLIKPVLHELQINCFSILEYPDITHAQLCEWIASADIVLAHVSTLTYDMIYELGIRHAVNPGTIIILEEDSSAYPLDPADTLAIAYAHLGNEPTETDTFKKELKQRIRSVLLQAEQKDDNAPKAEFPATVIPKSNEVGLSELLHDAEHAKNNNEFALAAELYKMCLMRQPNNTFLTQRLALVTYKNAKPTIKKAISEAEYLLEKLHREETTDTETLGLSGALYKRLFEETLSPAYLDKSIRFYSKGYYTSQSYYNGINYAYLLTVKATLQKDKFEALSFFNQAQRVRLNIANICTDLIAQQTFTKRGDKEWVYQSLAQAHLGLDHSHELESIIMNVRSYSKGKFDTNIFIQQQEKLAKHIVGIRKIVNGE